MSSEFDEKKMERTEKMKRMKRKIDKIMEEIYLSTTINKFLDKIDSLSEDEMIKTELEEKIPGEFDADVFYKVINELLGPADNGAINTLANYIGFKAWKVTDLWRYPDDIIEVNGEKYVGQLVIDYVDINGKKIEDIELYFYTNKLGDEE